MGVLHSETASKSADYAYRLRGAIEARCQPQGPLSINRLAGLTGRSRNTLKGWMSGQHDFSLSDLAALEAAAAQLGAGGIYAAVVRQAPLRWQQERLPLAALQDKKRIRLLQAFEAGDDVLALAAKDEKLSWPLVRLAHLLAGINWHFSWLLGRSKAVIAKRWNEPAWGFSLIENGIQVRRGDGSREDEYHLVGGRIDLMRRQFQRPEYGDGRGLADHLPLFERETNLGAGR